MASIDLTRLRLHNQGIFTPTFDTPAEVVSWLGAVQGQEYNQSLWGIGLRMRDATEATIEAAIADKSIVRTWFMRGTLHFVPGADLRWMLALMAPFMRRFINNVSNYQKLGLDDATFVKSQAVIEKALLGGKQLMRTELAAALERAGIEARGIRFSLLLQRAQADSLICYGPRRGKQVTFTLIDEWLPPSRMLERDQALAEFALRYFTGHGPATVQDFSTWSSLNLTDARAGLEAIKHYLTHEIIDNQTYWLTPPPPIPNPRPPTPNIVHLLPDYDELVMGYKDRSALMDPALLAKAGTVLDIAFSPPLLIDGKIAGKWKRLVKSKEVIVTVSPLAPLTEPQTRAVTAEAERFGRFVDLPVTLSFSDTDGA
jgi:hypothetical protein